MTVTEESWAQVARAPAGQVDDIYRHTMAELTGPGSDCQRQVTP